MSGRRQRKIAELIQREISILLQRHTRDPRLGFVTVTGVDVTADLKMATVYVALLDESERVKTMQGLASATSFLRHQVGQALTLRYVPDLTFKLDTSAQEGQKIEAIFDQIEAERKGRDVSAQ